MLLRKVDGRWHYYPMDGRRFVASGRGTANLTRNLDWSVAGIGDFDGDGRDDVLLRHADGRWYHYAMNGRRFISGTQGAADLPRDLAWRTPDVQQAGSTGEHAVHAVGETFKDCATCPEMVVVPAGTFTMGSPADEDGRASAEGPQHEVNFAVPFAIGVHEVTFREWDACVADGGCAYEPWDWDWGRGQRPVMDITWGQAQAYVDWLAAETGQPYRLPSEAEWEYAARAGTTTPFHFGATVSTDQANYDGTKPPYGDGVAGAYREQTVPVGSFPANDFGLHDVHGNVAEWVQDCGSDENWGYDDAPADGSAVEIAGCRERLSRGGGWWDEAAYLRSARRDLWNDEDWYTWDLGFRVARGVSGTAPGDGTVVGIDAPKLGVWLTTTTEVFFEWSAVEDATHYQLYLHHADGTMRKYDPFPVGDGTQRRLSGLVPATEYCFTITALDGNAESPHSARVCATTNTEDAAGPDAPDLRLDRVTETEVFLEWSPVPGATHYRFYSHLADGSTRTYWPFPASEGTRRRFSNLTPDTEYCYTLTALTADAESDQSERVCVTTNGEDTADDGDDTRAGARALPLGTVVEGTLDDSGDVDYWRIDVLSAGTLVIETTGDTDTVGRLEDASGNVLATDDNGGTGSNFRIERDIDAGTHYVRVSGADGATGGYRLSATHTGQRGGSTDAASFVGLTSFQIVASSDGVHWEAVYEGECCLRDVAYGGGLWVAVRSGRDVSTILTSLDGRSWTRTDYQANYRHELYLLGGVDFGDGVWIVAGSNAILRSVDGLNWTVVHGDDDHAAFHTDEVAFGNGLWVAGGVNDLFESTDGTDWAAVPRSKRPGCASPDDLAFGGGHWYAVDPLSLFHHSIACTRTASGDWEHFIDGFRGRRAPSAAAFGNSDWVGSGASGPDYEQVVIWEGGTNGLHWVDFPAAPGDLRPHVRGVAFYSGLWVVGSSYGPYWNRGDPRLEDDWTLVPRSQIEGLRNGRIGDDLDVMAAKGDR